MTRLGRARAFLRDRYFTIDPRTAGLFRVALGALLVLDCLRHWVEARLLYSIDGVFPNDKHLWQPSSNHLFSVFHAFSTPAEVHVLFALGFICHLALLVGYRSRLAALLSFVFVTSMDSRITLVENGGYVVVNLATLYAFFLPIEQRFSIDAWRASWRANKERTAAELESWVPAPESTRPVITAGVAVALFNFAMVYFFNVVNKTGNIWRKGDTVHYVLHIDRMVTGFGVLVREALPHAVLVVSDFLVLAVEAIIFMCIVWPFGRKLTRPLALVLIFGLHTTLGTMMRLGPFSWFMIGWSTLLILPIQWSMLRARRERRTSGCELGVDERSPLAVALGRVVARLDGYDRVRFVAGPAGGLLAIKKGDDDWDADATTVASRVLEALPGGGFLRRPVAVLLRTARRRERWITSFFGIDLDEAAPQTPAPLARRLKIVPRFFREALVVYIGACVVMQLWMENKAIPKQLPPPVKPDQKVQPHEQAALEWMKRILGDTVIPLKPEASPEFLQETITYPRISQGWGMFAPNPIQEDGVLAIDAYTIDGRRIDPLTGKLPDLDLTDSKGEGLSQLRQDYGNRIRQDRNSRYRDDLAEYLRRWHKLNGRPQDELVAFDVYWVKDKCPLPGSIVPTDGDPVPIYTWRKQGYERPEGMEKIPPQPKVRSAE
ncbi:MAG: HTTM domain-containing protein [Polyangiaceae bacterium]|nr:HTTM domain-containing protein [Polyangiaceae bacterium]